MENDLLAFLQNKQNYDLKNSLDEEITNLLYSFQRTLDELLDSGHHQPLFLRSKLPGKVSKGNNHYGYPYQVLDYSAYLSKDTSFSFRTSIWYGHYFSFALILSGHYVNDVSVDFESLRNKNYKITCDPNIWETDFSKQKTFDINDLSSSEFEKLKSSANQLRIFTHFSLNQTGELIRLGIESFKSLLIQE